MEQIAELDREAVLGRPPRYDWDTMLNGEAWRLHQNEDYTCTDASIRARIRKEARERGLKVVTILAEPGIVDVQAIL